MPRKPSTRLHEVYDRKFALIVFAGSQNACHAYWERQIANRRQELVVRVAGR